MSVSLVSLGESTSHYSFTANSLADALQQMLRLGPGDGDGNHAASCDVQASDILDGLQTGIVAGTTVQIPDMGWTTTAYITQGFLRYRFVFRLPLWSNVSSLIRPIQAEWGRYNRCLMIHERGHTRAAMPVLRRYQRQFESLRIAQMGSSAREAEEAAQRELRSQAREVYGLLANDVQNASDRYDRSTRHGRTQGAELRTLMRPRSRH